MNKTGTESVEGTQAEDQHKSETGNTAAEELDRIAAEADKSIDNGIEAGQEDKNADKTAQKTEDDKDGDKTDRVVFTPEQQAVFDKRLGKEVEKTRKAREELETLKQTRLENDAAIAANLRLHPAYVSPEDYSLIQAVNSLEAEQNALAELDLTEDIPIDALPESTRKWIQETTPKAESVDRKQISKRLLAIQRDLHGKVAKADAAYETAKQQQLSDLAMGRKIRLEREAARKKAELDGADKNKGTPATSGLKTVARPVATGTETRRGSVDQARLAAGGNTAAALIDAM